MRPLLPVVLLLAGCASGEIRPPSVVVGPSLLQVQLEDAVATLNTASASCGDLDAFAAKWQALLSIRDWKVSTSCAWIPESENAAAISYSDPYRRTVAMVVDPNGGEAELLVLHELAHVLFTVTCEAKSEVVEEQIVVGLSELLLQLEKAK